MFELQLWQGILHGLCFQLQEQIRFEQDSLFYFPHEFLIADRKTFALFLQQKLCPLPQQAEVSAKFSIPTGETQRNAFEIDFTQTCLQNTENRNFVAWIFQFIGKLFKFQECHW